MFFPTSPHLPTVGDVVCFRHQHQPYTVALHSPDRTLYHLIGLDEPARVEVLAWYPTVGDRVEVLFCPYAQYLQGKFDQYLRQRYSAKGSDKEAIDRTLGRIKTAMKQAQNYRTGELLRVEGELAQVKFSGGAEVLPFHCLAVVDRDPKTQQPAAALPPVSFPSPASIAHTHPAPARESRPTPDKIPALHRQLESL